MDDCTVASIGGHISTPKPLCHHLAGTFPAHGGIAVAEGIWEDLVPVPVDVRGCNEQLATASGDVRIAWHRERKQQGTHVEIRGPELDRMRSNAEDVHGLVAYMMLNDLRATRVDLAWDDRAAALDMAVIREAYEQRAFRTLPGRRPVNAAQYVSSHVGDGLSETVYIPHDRGGSGHVAIYTRRQYVMAHGLADPGPWIRVELRAKQDRAKQAAAWYASEDWPRLVALCRHYCEFLEPTSDGNRSRWPVAGWWAAFWDTWNAKEVSAFDVRLRQEVIPEGLRTMNQARWYTHTLLPYVGRRWASEGLDLTWLVVELRQAIQRDALKHPGEYAPELAEAAASGRLAEILADRTGLDVA